MSGMLDLFFFGDLGPCDPKIEERKPILAALSVAKLAMRVSAFGLSVLSLSAPWVLCPILLSAAYLQFEWSLILSNAHKMLQDPSIEILYILKTSQCVKQLLQWAPLTRRLPEIALYI